MNCQECLFYYGVEVPDLVKTRALEGTFVVMQDDHPVLASGMYGEFFPGCRRFVYWDPTRIAQRDFDALAPGLLPSIGVDHEWGTVMLDLNERACRDYAVGRARRALAVEGADGLFVDNLDTWAAAADQRRVVLAVLDEVGRTGAAPVSFFVNRGFQLWHRLEHLAAILLESLMPEQVLTAPEDHLSWYENLVALYFANLEHRHKGVPVFALGYSAPPPAPVPWADEGVGRREVLRQRLAAYVTRSYYKDRLLAQWPDAVRR